MDVRVPNLGEGADSGSVVSVFVKEGDEIQEGQTLIELENEKAVAPIPSPAAGKVGKIRVKEGDKLSVGQVILSLVGGGEPAAEAKSEKEEGEREERPESDEAPEKEPKEAEGRESEEAEKPERKESLGSAGQAGLPEAAAPSIRKLARDLGIELARVKGSGRGGRILLEDVRGYIQKLQRQAFPKKEGKAEKPVEEKIDFGKWGSVRTKPVSALRKTIGRRMHDSWTTIPHVTQFDEADISGILEFRKKYNPAYERAGTKLTVTSFALRVAAEALGKHAIFNSSLDEAAGEIVFKEYIHIGLAVDTEAGLLVPVIRDVDKKNLLELSKELGELAEKARERKISLEEMKGGSFTISNQGGIGGAHFTPIVNKPEVAILGMGKAVLKPVAREGKIEPRMMLPLALSYDHRVIDGAQAARFIQEILAGFENYKEEQVKL